MALAARVARVASSCGDSFRFVSFRFVFRGFVRVRARSFRSLARARARRSRALVSVARVPSQPVYSRRVARPSRSSIYPNRPTRAIK